MAGKIALVTGAASATGIGLGCVRRLAQEGAVVYGADIDVVSGEASLSKLAAEGLTVQFIRLDVTSENEWQKAVDQIIAEQGRLDILVNNAGVAFSASIADTTLQQFRDLNRINFHGSYLGIKHAVRVMRGNQPTGGSIVNLSSIAGHVGLRNYVAYCASKGGVKNMTRATALECGAERDGIRINNIHPGVIWTAMNEGEFADEATARQVAKTMSPLGLLGYPEDIADGVLFLASDESSYMTGASLTIDGGMTAR